MYAIIEASGKQFKAQAGDVINFDRMEGKAGDKITFDKVLLIAGGKDNKVLIGKPYLSSAKLTGEVVTVDNLGEKILTIKYIRRKQYRRTIGHRSKFTQILVTKIEDGQGGITEYDNSKRKEILMKANVKTATAKAAKAKTSAGAEKVEKTSSTKKASTKTTAKKKA